MTPSLQAWLHAVKRAPGGDILAIQTLRNALMAASVLACLAWDVTRFVTRRDINTRL